MHDGEDPTARVVNFSKRSSAVTGSILVGLLVAFLVIFISEGRQSTKTELPITQDELISDKKTQIAAGIRSTFKAYAGSESTPETSEVTFTFSPDKKYLTVNYSLNALDYTSIALHQEYLTGHSFDGKYGGPFGNPFCDNYDGDLIYQILLRLSWGGLELPSDGIYINLRKFDTEEITDKYGNNSIKMTKLPSTKFGISMVDFKKINWGGGGINLKALSTLVPFSNPDVSWCHSEIVYGALLNLD